MVPFGKWRTGATCVSHTPSRRMAQRLTKAQGDVAERAAPSPAASVKWTLLISSSQPGRSSGTEEISRSV